MGDAPRGLDPTVRRRQLAIAADTWDLDGTRHRARVENFERVFEFDSDEPPSLGGSNQHPTPLEYFASAVGLCLLSQIERYARMLKADIKGARCRVTLELEAEGSVLEGTISSRCRSVHTEVEVESDDDAALVAAVLRNADRGCYVRSTIREPVDIDTSVHLNGAPVDLAAFPPHVARSR